MALILAVLGAVLIAIGCFVVSLPLGLVVLGGELIAAAYVHRFLEANE